MDDPFSQVRVGVGVMLWHDGKVLLGRRKGAHGAGQLSFPGGHMEKGESIEECVLREMREEVGPAVEFVNLRHQVTARSSRFMPRDYLHIGMSAKWVSGEPVLMEPDKCDGWSWYPFDDVPVREMFLFAALAVDAHRKSCVFYDADDVDAFDLWRAS